MNLSVNRVNNDKSTNFNGLRRVKISDLTKKGIKVAEKVMSGTDFKNVSYREKFDVDLIGKVGNILECKFIDHNGDTIDSVNKDLGLYIFSNKKINKLVDSFNKMLNDKFSSLVESGKIDPYKYDY